MKNINKKLSEYKWDIFPICSIGLSLFMTHFHHWTIALIEGLVLSMFIVFLLFKKKTTQSNKSNDDKLIMINTPRSVTYILAFGFWFAFSFFIFSFTLPNVGKITYILFFFAFTLLMLYSLYSTLIQYIVGEDTISARTNYSFLFEDKTYKLKDIKSINILPYLQTLKITFNDNKSFHIHTMSENLIELPAYKGQLKRPQLELLYRLEQEIILRKNTSNNSQYEIEKSQIEKIKFNSISILGFFFTFLLNIIFFIGLFLAIQSSELKRFNTLNPQEITLNDISRAFELYKGKKFYQLKNEFENKCKELNDYNCKVAYHFKEFAKEPDSLDFIRKSCSHKEPQSCYLLYSHSSSSETDQELASSILEKACKIDEYKEKKCCTCYQSRKSQKLPASL